MIGVFEDDFWGVIGGLLFWLFVCVIANGDCAGIFVPATFFCWLFTEEIAEVALTTKGKVEFSFPTWFIIKSWFLVESKTVSWLLFEEIWKKELLVKLL